MIYRKDKAGNELSALGLGCMRFPRDKSEVERLVLAAVNGGVNFFDTAYIYPGSEAALGGILAKHGLRKNVRIATKLPLMLLKSSSDFDRFFDIQLSRLQTDYIDYYFMHNMSEFGQWEMLQRLGIEDWLEQKKKSGQIRQAGFSFHSTADVFVRTLDAYSWDFAMIQYNYYDINYQAGRAGLHAAAERGVAVMIMEPLLGGKLATGLPKQAVDLFAKINPDLSPADWAFWWLWNQKEVTTVPSGMNSAKVLEQNLRSVANFRPLTQDELAIFDKVVEVFRKAFKIPCTGCNYCLPCPKGINIPACLSAYNTSCAHGRFAGFPAYYTSIGVLQKSPISPTICNKCGLCEKNCPQQIAIRKEFKRVIRRFEPLPLRAVLNLVRRIVNKNRP